MTRRRCGTAAGPIRRSDPPKAQPPAPEPDLPAEADMPAHVAPQRTGSGALARELLLVPPTEASFAAVDRTLRAIPRAAQGTFLKVLRAAGCHPWVFQLALATVWCNGGGCRVVAAAAGDRATLKAWFSSARFDWPADEIIGEALTVWTPRELTVYRGGRGDPAKLAAEFSWTPLLPIAAIYAVANPHPHPAADGAPVVVRRTVARAEVAVKWINGAQETVLLDEGPWSVETRDVDRIAELVAEGRRLQAEHRRHQAAFVERHLVRQRDSVGS